MESKRVKRRKTCKQRIKKFRIESGKYMREFSDVTTLHGIRFVGEEETHFVERIFWVVAIFFCAGFCGFEIVKVWDRWQMSPIIISFAQQPTNIVNIPLPAVTICPETVIKRSVVDLEQNYSQILAQWNGSMEYESYEQQLLLEAVRMLLPNFDDPYLVNETGVRPTKEHIKIIAGKISLQIDDIFDKCYLGILGEGCDKLFRPTLVNHAGLCYTFNSLDNSNLYKEIMDMNPLDIPEFEPKNMTWDPEAGYTDLPEEFEELQDFPHRLTRSNAGDYARLLIILKNPEVEMQKITDMKNTGKYRIIVHSPLEIPQLTQTNVLYTRKGILKEIVLRPTSMTNAPEIKNYKPKVRGCFYPGEKKLKLFKVYTQENCIFDCELEKLKQTCGRTQWTAPTIKDENIPFFNVPYHTNTNACTLEKFMDYEAQRDKTDDMVWRNLNLQGNAARCGCLPSCTELYYQYHINEDSSNSELNESAIKIYFESPTFIGKHRSELYSLTDFIASCGGLLGLFTGFSVITAIEIFYFASLRICCKLRRQRQVIHQVTA